MAIPQEGDSSAVVLNEALRIGARVKADDPVSEHAPRLLAQRHALKLAMRERQDADDEVILCEGAVDSRRAATDAEVTAFGSRVAGHYAKAGAPGEEHAEYVRLFDERTPSKLLPAADADRVAAVAELETRIEAKETALEIKKGAAGLLAAIGREQEAVTARDKANKKLDQASAREAAAKTGLIQAVRECSGSLLKTLPAEPGRVRRLLGQKEPRRTKKKEKGDTTPPAAPAQ